MSKVPYNTTHYPPLPSLAMTLYLPSETVGVGPFPSLVDTGADATLVPNFYLQQLNAPIWAEANLRSHWGEPRLVYTYLLDVEVDGEHTLPGIIVVGDDQSQDIVLGRNLLNKLILLLDGPQTTLYVLSQRPRHLR